MFRSSNGHFVLCSRIAKVLSGMCLLLFALQYSICLQSSLSSTFTFSNPVCWCAGPSLRNEPYQRRLTMLKCNDKLQWNCGCIDCRGGGWVADIFATTPKMSAYLVAFVVGDFKKMSAKGVNRYDVMKILLHVFHVVSTEDVRVSISTLCF